MSSLVEVVEVDVSDVAQEELAGFGIDQPKSGSERSTYSLTVRGWVLGRSAAVEAVELIHDSVLLRRLVLAGKREDVAAANPDVAGAAASEFYAVISSLSIAPEFEITVQAVLANDARVRIGAIRGRRKPIRSRFEPRLAPLMLTSTGRVGSTVMMNALGAHPQIAAYPPFRKEPRVATYWMEVLAKLSEPASYIRQLAPGGPLQDGWWLGSEEPMPRTTSNDDLERWLGADAVESLAVVCQERIEALYSRVAVDNGRPDAIYFAEKFGTDSVPALIWELYPRTREVILVRDFRDIACSILASSAKRKGREQPHPSTVLGDIVGRTNSILRVWQQRSKKAHLVRYEDLIQQPTETLEGLVAYLDVESSSDAIESMVAALSEGGDAAAFHRTVSTADASIGRWRRDLDDDLQREFSLVLREGLEAFGYALD